MAKHKSKFTDDFKLNIVKLYQNGKSSQQLSKEYDIGTSTIYKWLREHKTSGSFNEKDNLTDTEKELIEVKKRNKELEMENDLLKQVAVILGKK